MSIAEGPVTVVVKREAMSPAGEGRRDSSNRASIIQVTIQSHSARPGVITLLPWLSVRLGQMDMYLSYWSCEANIKFATVMEHTSATSAQHAGHATTYFVFWSTLAGMHLVLKQFIFSGLTRQEGKESEILYQWGQVFQGGCLACFRVGGWFKG